MISDIAENTLRLDKITELLFIAGNMPHLSVDEMEPTLRFPGMCVCSYPSIRFHGKITRSP
jgi:hypothetical protein